MQENGSYSAQRTIFCRSNGMKKIAQCYAIARNLRSIVLQYLLGVSQALRLTLPSSAILNTIEIKHCSCLQLVVLPLEPSFEVVHVYLYCRHGWIYQPHYTPGGVAFIFIYYSFKHAIALLTQEKTGMAIYMRMCLCICLCVHAYAYICVYITIHN